MARTARTGTDPHLTNPVAQTEHDTQPTDVDTINPEHNHDASTDPTIQPVHTVVHPRPHAEPKNAIEACWRQQRQNHITTRRAV